MSLRLAAYALCIKGGHALLALSVPVKGEPTWTLPGGRVEQDEDPYDTVIRELMEETGYEGIVTQLLGVDSRLIAAAERAVAGLPDHQNVGIFYRVHVTGGELRPEPNSDTQQSVWTSIAEVSRLRRSSLVDVGLALAETTPATGHVEHVKVGGLVQH